MIIPKELFDVAGLAVINHFGESVLTEMGKKSMATYWSIILNIASGVLTIKFFMDGTRQIAAVFGVFF